MYQRPLEKHALGSEALVNWQSIETISKLTAAGLRDTHIAVMDRNDVGLVAIETHLVSSRSEKNAQNYIYLSLYKTGVRY